MQEWDDVMERSERKGIKGKNKWIIKRRNSGIK